MRVLLAAKPFLLPAGLFCLSMTAGVIVYSTSGPASTVESGASVQRANIEGGSPQTDAELEDVVPFGNVPTDYSAKQTSSKVQAVSLGGRSFVNIIGTKADLHVNKVQPIEYQPSALNSQGVNEALFSPESLNSTSPFASGGASGVSAGSFASLIEVGGTGADAGRADGGDGDNGGTVVTFAVPEPSTWAMLLLGIVAIAALGCGRRNHRSTKFPASV